LLLAVADACGCWYLCLLACCCYCLLLLAAGSIIATSYCKVAARAGLSIPEALGKLRINSSKESSSRKHRQQQAAVAAAANDNSKQHGQ